MRSLARIFPKLSLEQIETLMNEFGEEVVQMLKETREAIDDERGTEEK